MGKEEKSAKIKAMTQTEGWAILKDSLVRRYKGAVKALVSDSNSDPMYIATQRARCRLIREIFSEAGISEEELN